MYSYLPLMVLPIYVALELMALSSYILAGYFKRETKSLEASSSCTPRT